MTSGTIFKERNINIEENEKLEGFPWYLTVAYNPHDQIYII